MRLLKALIMARRRCKEKRWYLMDQSSVTEVIHGLLSYLVEWLSRCHSAGRGKPPSCHSWPGRGPLKQQTRL